MTDFNEMISDVPQMSEEDFEHAIAARRRERLARGEIQDGKEISALRRSIGLSQPQFASALGISVHTLRNWEQARRSPEGPARALLRIAARHPSVVRENLPPEA